MDVEQGEDEHVGVVEGLGEEQEDELAGRMVDDLLVAEALPGQKPPEVFDQNPVERAEAIDQRGVEMLVTMERPSHVMRGKAKNVTGDESGVGFPDVDE